MKTLRVGTRVFYTVLRWPDIAPDERTPRNAQVYLQQAHVAELDWTPPHQRLVIRMIDAAGREIALTRHELEMNGARNG